VRAGCEEVLDTFGSTEPPVSPATPSTEEGSHWISLVRKTGAKTLSRLGEREGPVARSAMGG
ncbi:MAG TPA: hypothetical protein VHP59_19970, partial [Vineibacter terrae]|nr:hypothetical protein [Vineibacter terrae]